MFCFGGLGLYKYILSALIYFFHSFQRIVLTIASRWIGFMTQSVISIMGPRVRIFNENNF